MTQAVDSAGGTITEAYDNLDRLTSETTPQGQISYGYDLAGRRASMTVAGQPQVTYSYDNANRLTQIAQGTSTVGCSYDTVSRRSTLTLGRKAEQEGGTKSTGRHFFTDALSTHNDLMTGKPIPVETEGGAMPTNNSFRRYDYQGLLPFRPEPSDNDPKQLIDSSKSGLWFPALQSQELLAKGQIFQQEITSRVETASKETQQEPEHGKLYSRRRGRLALWKLLKSQQITIWRTTSGFCWLITLILDGLNGPSMQE